MAELVGHARRRALATALRIEVWPSETTPTIGTGQRLLDLAEQLRQVVLGRRQQAPGQEDLAGEDIADDPEDLVADVGLQAVDGQDDPPGLRRDGRQALGVRARQGQQLVVAVQEVADAADADRHAAAGQFGVDLGDAAVLGVAEHADQGDDVEAEFVLGQGEAPLLLGPEAGLVAGALGIAAAADLEPEPDEALQGHDGPLGLVGRPERPATGGAVPRVRGSSMVRSGRAGHSVAAWGTP